MTGISQYPSIFKLLFLLLLLLLLFVYTRKPTKGIIVIAGILVKIANPKKIPESKIRIKLLFLLSLLLFFEERFVYNANNIEDNRKGIKIVSKSIHLLSQLRGITAKRTDAITATFLL
jgi:energy-coupling factor transporter transmembrane protein EcfT